MMKENLKIKEELYNHCLEFIDNRFQTVQNTIKEIQESLQSETKSSAGDKHETGRAMLQLEREKAGHQLAEIEKIKIVLNKVNPDTKPTSVTLGSVVYTSQSNYFIAISAGEITINSNKFFAISAATPIAKLLISKVVGDKIVFRDKTITITKIL